MRSTTSPTASCRQCHVQAGSPDLAVVPGAVRAMGFLTRQRACVRLTGGLAVSLCIAGCSKREGMPGPTVRVSWQLCWPAASRSQRSFRTSMTPGASSSGCCMQVFCHIHRVEGDQCTVPGGRDERAMLSLMAASHRMGCILGLLLMPEVAELLHFFLSLE